MTTCPSCGRYPLIGRADDGRLWCSVFGDRHGIEVTAPRQHNHDLDARIDNVLLDLHRRYGRHLKAVS